MSRLFGVLFAPVVCLLLTIVAAHQANGDIVVQPGETCVLAGTIDENVVNNGTLTGGGEPLVFAAGTLVSGAGHFDHAEMLGTFAPGNSPAAVSTNNLIMGGASTLEFELGGTVPGFGAGRHDQVNDTGTVTLLGGTIKVSPFGGFLPAIGDQFVVITWQTGLSGAFGTMMIDPWFTSQGINFTQNIANPGGSGTLTLLATAVPEASPLLLMIGAGSAWLFLSQSAAWIRRRRLC